MFKPTHKMTREEIEAEIRVIWALMSGQQRLEFILTLRPDLRAEFFPKFKMETA